MPADPTDIVQGVARAVAGIACAVSLCAASAAAAKPAPQICTVEIRLTAITCLEAYDETERSSARGEYFLRLGTRAEIGPFELRKGESSSFSPGILLDVIDTGIPQPAEGEALLIPIELHVSAREADSSQPGEDDADDLSAPVPITERVACPRGTTSITRAIEIPANVSERPDAAVTRAARRKSDRLKVSLKLVASR